MIVTAFTKLLELCGIRQVSGEQGVRMKNRIQLDVHLAFDEEANVWYVAKSEIPGLSLEADTPSDLLARIADCAPEMLELNEGVISKVVGMKEIPTRERLPQRRVKKASRQTPYSLNPVFDSPMHLAHA